MFAILYTNTAEKFKENHESYRRAFHEMGKLTSRY
jgi:hypothetical protein